jgi:hypothetical protein
MNQTPDYDTDIKLSINTATTTEAMAAMSGKCNRVQGMRISAAGTGIVTIKRGTTALESFNCIAGTQIMLPLRKRAYFISAANEAINITTSAAVQIDIRIEAVVA